MKKILILSLLIILLTGCNVTYNIELTDDIVNDKIEISGSRDMFVEYSKDENKTNYISDILFRIENNRNNLTKQKFINRDTLKYVYSGNIEYNDILFLTPFSRWCYDEASMFLEDENKVIFTTSDKFLCYDLYSELENVKVNITSKYDVIENNADEIQGNTYTWIINRDNKDNKKIYIKIDKNSKVKNVKTEKNDILIYLKYIIELTIIIVAMVVIIKFIKKRQMD